MYPTLSNNIYVHFVKTHQIHYLFTILRNYFSITAIESLISVFSSVFAADRIPLAKNRHCRAVVNACVSKYVYAENSLVHSDNNRKPYIEVSIFGIVYCKKH